MKRIIAFMLLAVVVLLTGCNADKEQITALNEEIAALEENNTELKNEIKTQNTEIIALEKTNMELEKTNKELDNELSTAKTELEKYAPIADIEKEIASLNTQVGDLEKQIQEKQATLDDLTSKVDLAQLEENRRAKEGTTVYEDNNVKINYVKVGNNYNNKKSVVFLVENKTNITITIQCDSIALDYFTIDDYISMSDEVAAQSKGYVYAKSDRIDNNAPSVISGGLRVIDFSRTLFNSYSAYFTNVVVK